MSKRYAVIDLGSNIFHLLIAEAGDGGSFRAMLSERRFVKLAAEGLERLGEAPFERGLETIRAFHRLLEEYGASQVRMIGTAALRTASNGPDFLAEVRRLTGLEIEVISGDQEAEWIYRGVCQAVHLGEAFALIMDIGGGSVEFMLANEAGLAWRRSFPVGMTVLFRRFHRHDPISTAESRRIYAFLEKTLAPLWTQLARFPPQILIGAEGPFEILAAFLPHRLITLHQRNFEAGDIIRLHQFITASTLEQRLTMPQLQSERADLIVVAMELIFFMLKKTGVREAAVSDFALKEGILADMIGKT